MNWIIGSIIILFIATSYETLARRRGYPKLTTNMLHLANLSMIFWIWLGKKVSNLFGLWNILENLLRNLWTELYEFALSLNDLLQSVLTLCLSWVYFIVGFLNTKYFIFSIITFGTGIGVYVYKNYEMEYFSVLFQYRQEIFCTLSNLLLLILCVYKNLFHCVLNRYGYEYMESRFYQTVFAFVMLLSIASCSRDQHFELYLLMPSLFNVLLSVSFYVKNMKDIIDYYHNKHGCEE